MFERRDLPSSVTAVRDEHAPGALVFDCASDFETLPPEQAEELGLVVDGFDPVSYPEEWLSSDAPAMLAQYAGSAFTIGAPGDGSVVWTRQTDPPVVLVKPRVQGSPDAFVQFLLAEALVQIGLDTRVPETDERPPEQFLGFFRESYPELAAATPLDPNATYQLAAALYEGWLGLLTRPVFRSWSDEHPELYAAWVDAGERIEPRLDGLHGELARGDTPFPAAAEFACSAIKHGLDLSAPYAALDTAAYRDHGAPYAVTWAQKTFDALSE